MASENYFNKVHILTHPMLLTRPVRSYARSISSVPSVPSRTQEIVSILPRMGAVFNTSSTPSSTISPTSFQNVFSRENRERTIFNIQNKKTGLKYMERVLKRTRKASVLIPLCFDKTGQPAILYTLRSLNMNTHRGEISFPGGATDPEDNDDYITTALRETEEELGISRDSVDIWTTLSPMPTIIALLGVTPVLGFLNVGNLDPEKLKISPNEVEKAFTVTLEHFCNPTHWRDRVQLGIPWPVYKNLNIRHPKTADTDDPPDVPIWGFTAIITHVILKALLPELYKRSIPLLEARPLIQTGSKL